MKINRMLSLFAAAGLSGLLTCPAAYANGWPASVVGSWTAQANGFPLVLRISNQAAGKGCVAISGTIADARGGQTNNIQGFYCPPSGRISFLRKNTSNNDTFQVYAANLSVNGSTNYMGGTFAEENSASNLGEYNFQAQK